MAAADDYAKARAEGNDKEIAEIIFDVVANGTSKDLQDLYAAARGQK